MKTERISVDLDGVICSFNQQVVAASQILWPGRVPLDYVPPDWDHSDIFKKEDWDLLWKYIHDQEDFWETSPEYADNVNQLFHGLRANPNVDVYYITSRARTKGQSVLHQTNHWLADRGLRTPNTSVIPVHHPNEKKKIIQSLRIQYSLDDFDITVIGCDCIEIGEKEHHRAFVLDRKWNQNTTVWLDRVYSIQGYFQKIGLKTNSS